MRELCDRVLIDPFDKGIPEVTWANTCIRYGNMSISWP